MWPFMHSVNQRPSVDVWCKCVHLQEQQKKSDTDRVKVLWDQGQADLYQTASAQISYTSRVHWAEDFQKPASGCPIPSLKPILVGY